jgi:hypothetical protein
VPHLNKLHDTFGARGLSIVAVSNEKPHLIDRYIRGTGIRYGVVRAQGVGHAYGVRGTPHAWLIGRDGRVGWRGHPAQLTPDIVESALAGGVTTAAGFPPPRVPWSIPWGSIVMVLAVQFTAAMAWFWWVTRDRTVRDAAPVLPPPPPPPEAPAPSEYRPRIRQLGVGGANPFAAGAKERTHTSEYREEDKEARYLGGPQPPRD